MEWFGTESSPQLALAVDGVPLVGAAPDYYVLQAALAGLDQVERRLAGRLRERLGPDVGVVDHYFDAVPRLLELLGFRPRLIASEDLPDACVRVAAIGCPHRRIRLDAVDTQRFFDRGGILLSSDRAARLPGVASHLQHLAGRPPARARMVVQGEDEGSGQPAVWLDAGHLPLDPVDLHSQGAATLGWDSLTGDPLAARVPAGRGAIIHSVPHWVQCARPEQVTAVESRPLRSAPVFTAIGNSYPGVTLGAFLAQRAMVRVLIQGLAGAVRELPTESGRRAEG